MYFNNKICIAILTALALCSVDAALAQGNVEYTPQQRLEMRKQMQEKWRNMEDADKTNLKQRMDDRWRGIRENWDNMDEAQKQTYREEHKQKRENMREKYQELTPQERRIMREDFQQRRGSMRHQWEQMELEEKQQRLEKLPQNRIEALEKGKQRQPALLPNQRAPRSIGADR